MLFGANLVVLSWRRGHVAVRICQVHRGTVETDDRTCGWARTVASRSFWKTSSRLRRRLFPLRWRLGRTEADRRVPSTWRRVFPADTRSGHVWCSCETTGRRSLNQILWPRTYMTRDSKDRAYAYRRAVKRKISRMQKEREDL